MITLDMMKANGEILKSFLDYTSTRHACTPQLS